MKPLMLLGRAAGKSPRYLLQRSWREARRRARSGRLRRRLARLGPQEIARASGETSLEGLWRRRVDCGFLLTSDDREAIHKLYRKGPYVAEADRLRHQVEKILTHEFDILGSGPIRLGAEIDWYVDFKSGRRWELRPSHTIDYAELDRESDVKVPWELSRGQHLTALAQAWVVDSDERCLREIEAEIQSWIRANPVGFGINWACTMDVALRAVSWVWTLAILGDAPFSSGFLEQALLSLYHHGLWIPENLEFAEVNGNHTISDALGLVACGAVFAAAPEGCGWLNLGQRILEEEIRLQVEEDGVDIEASTQYHRLVLEIFLVGERLLLAAGRAVSDGYRRRLEKMFEFVYTYVTPEGLSPVIGDADDGRALILGRNDIRDHRYLLSTAAALFDRADFKERAGRFWEDSLWLLGASAEARFQELAPVLSSEKSRGFPVVGFYVLRSREQYLFVDAGPVGFRGLGGHGHNDCLSFEWHAHGRPLLTDSGSYLYTASRDWRNRFRSTDFHNAIRVDEEEINRFSSPLALWSLRNDAVPIGVRFEPAAEGSILEAGHTGYRRLRDPVTAVRRFEMRRDRAEIRLIDRLEGRAEHFVEFFFHAAPGAEVRRISEDAVECRWADETSIRIERVSGPPVTWEAREGWFSPSYGVKVPRPVWRAWTRRILPLRIEWKLTAQSGLSR